MKHKLTILLTAVMAALLIAGCANGSNAAKSASASVSSGHDIELVRLENFTTPDENSSTDDINLSLVADRPLEKVDTPITDVLRMLPADASSNDAKAYLETVKDAIVALDWNERQPFISTTDNFDNLSVNYSGERIDNDGNFVENEHQGASVYLPRIPEEQKLSAHFTCAMLADETSQDLDVAYYANFLTQATGRKISPSLLLSILDYGERSMTKQDGSDYLGKSFSVQFTDPNDSTNSVRIEADFIKFSEDGAWTAEVKLEDWHILSA